MPNSGQNGVADPYCSTIDPQLLAAVSSRMAVFPFREPPQDPKYPPLADVAFANRHPVVHEKRTRGFGAFSLGRKEKVPGSENGKESHKDKQSVQGKLSHRVSRRVSFLQTQDKVDGKAGTKTSVDATDFSVPYDVLSSLCGLCFPGKLCFIMFSK